MSRAKKVKVENLDGLKLNGQLQNSEIGYATAQELFTLCPKEIWCMILLSLEDSKDVFNALKAYPEMEGLVQYKRHLWLFDRVKTQVIPNIAAWIDEKDLLACRLVCTHWSKGVDNFLENHSSLRAYQHDNQLTGQVWGLNDYSKCFHGPTYHHPAYQFSKLYFQTGFVFNEIQKFTRFSQSIKNHSKGRNPIVGRHVTLHLNDVRDNYAEEGQITEFWDKAHSFLRQYGEHIWFISIWGCKSQNARNSFQTLQQTLSLLSNLKCLEVNSASSWISRRNFTTLKPDGFPILPNLETLKLGFSFRTLSDTLIRLYGSQIRRLVLSPGWVWEWKVEYLSLFPNITELEIRCTTSVRGKPWMERMNELLLLIDAPQLHWLHVEVPEHNWLEIGQICRWLRRFPRLKNFRLGGFVGYHERGMVPISSLESLTIHETLVIPKFLLCFPSLQCLELRVQCGNYHDFGHQSAPNPLKFYQKCIQNGNLANVWILLPKLKTLILFNNCMDIRDRFDRPKFERYLRGLASFDGSEGESADGEMNASDDDDNAN